MKELPAANSEKGLEFTVADFVEAGRERLRLEVVAGAGNLSRRIEEPIVNRPGLALTGFFSHFAWKRLQLVGKGEMAYLRSLSAEERLSRMRSLFEHKVYCVIYTNGQMPSPQEIGLAERCGAVLLASPLKTRVFTHHSAFVLEALGAPRTSIYGTMIEVCGIGVMVEGDPGLGKSETALGLVKRGHALIADDLTCIRKDAMNGLLFGSASESTAGFMEIRGLGIMHVPSVFGINSVRGEKRLQLVVTFKKLNDIAGEIDRVGQTRRFKRILGVDIPNVIIPVSEGRDLVNLVETAAQQEKLMASGYDPVKALSDHLKKRADKKGNR
ncbi:MAG: HPr(Ser) kinase/phosphatase [Kiritimatiellae bacterium]|nr:HPr(Ser) kinase/phosphatase [Kiritimatiellia bacterium]